MEEPLAALEITVDELRTASTGPRLGGPERSRPGRHIAGRVRRTWRMFTSTGRDGEVLLVDDIVTTGHRLGGVRTLACAGFQVVVLALPAPDDQFLPHR